ncbi:hypothetical protein [Pedobacter sp.]|uniref:hypothetical protein n=1 Tax=Pedobacter sp. TaxID=1411316 RepID=UPI0031D4A631
MNKKPFSSGFKLGAMLIACFITNLSFAAEHKLPVKQSKTTSTTSTSDLTPVSTSAERRAHFNIIVQSNQTILSWSTIELKNGKYEIYRSDDSKNFVKIGEKTIVGNPSEPSLYIFHDEEPLKGLNHYKLVKQDNAGNNTEIAEKKVFLDSKVPAILSANPTPKVNRI